MMQPHTTVPKNEAPKRAAYQAPVVRDLGAWTTLTLIYSAPINPGPTGGNTNVF